MSAKVKKSDICRHGETYKHASSSEADLRHAYVWSVTFQKAYEARKDEGWRAGTAQRRGFF